MTSTTELEETAAPEPEQEERLEMVNKDRLDKELGKEGLK